MTFISYSLQSTYVIKSKNMKLLYHKKHINIIIYYLLAICSIAPLRLLSQPITTTSDTKQPITSSGTNQPITTTVSTKQPITTTSDTRQPIATTIGTEKLITTTTITNHPITTTVGTKQPITATASNNQPITTSVSTDQPIRKPDTVIVSRMTDHDAVILPKHMNCSHVLRSTTSRVVKGNCDCSVTTPILYYGFKRALGSVNIGCFSNDEICPGIANPFVTNT